MLISYRHTPSETRFSVIARVVRARCQQHAATTGFTSETRFSVIARVVRARCQQRATATGYTGETRSSIVARVVRARWQQHATATGYTSETRSSITAWCTSEETATRRQALDIPARQCSVPLRAIHERDNSDKHW